MSKSYTVNQAIWLVAAIYAYEQYNNGESSSELDYCLSASELQSKAQNIAKSDVQVARIHQHVNGDHENCSNRFIRRIEISEGKPVFRATAKGEFNGDKESPDDMDFNVEIEIDGKKYLLSEVKEFMDVDYPVIIHSFKDDFTALYSISEIREVLKSHGVKTKDIAANMVQIGDDRSTICVAKDNSYILYATDDDFKKIVAAKSLQKNVTTYHPQTKEIMLDIIAKENRRNDAVLCFEGGNKVLHPSTATKKKAHEIRLYSNDCFNKVMNELLGFTMREKKASCTKWMIAGNPTQYDVIGAFSKLGKIDWRQTFNAKVGDIVYIYVSDSIKEFRYKCKVNKTDLENVEIADAEFNVSGEFDGSYGRYMELEPIKYLGGPEYGREELLKHGFKTLMGPMRVPAELQEYLDLLELNEYTPSLAEYDPKISADEYFNLLKDETVVRKDILDTIYYIYDFGGEATCAQLAAKYGNGHEHYNMNGRNTAKAIYEATECDIQTNERGQKKYWPVLFVGRETRKDEPGTWVWKLREPLKQAIEMLINDRFFDGFEGEVSRAVNDTTEFDKNLILYGPPGTGKTYNSAIIAVKICEPSFDTSDYSAVMEKYNELKAQHRIAFTTFHQSYGYEEFIEGIKPVVDADNEAEIGYSIEPGCFKRFCEIARTPASISVDPNASIWFMRLDSDNAKVRKDTCFEKNIINDECIDDWSKERFIDMMQIGDYVISYAGNSVFIDAIGVIEGEAYTNDSLESFKWERKVKWTVLEEKVDVKAINGNKYLPNFSIAKMNHMKLSDLLRLIPVNKAVEEQPYVFIIDEINRGNISKIFGELITLIENTKREGMNEAASAILPYSGESFSVPSNVYILGTMNTADRSIALMDTALRRRFSFIEMMPDAEVLRRIGANAVVVDEKVLDVAKMLETINERIAFLYDREHTIGHAFFTGLAKDSTVEKLASIFSKSVIPLLQEYFYEDYQKIQLVLGDNAKKNEENKFILDTKVNLKQLFRGNVEDIVDEKEVKYSINEEALRDIESYIEIMDEQ